MENCLDYFVPGNYFYVGSRRCFPCTTAVPRLFGHFFSWDCFWIIGILQSLDNCEYDRPCFL